MKESASISYNEADLFLFFPGDINTINKFTHLIKMIQNDEDKFKNSHIILYNKKYWNSFIAWFDFNSMLFPHKYITKIVNCKDE